MPGGTMWSGSLPPTPVPQMMHGSITVDLVDASKKQLVWRATAKGKMDYDKRSKILDQANKPWRKCLRNIRHPNNAR